MDDGRSRPLGWAVGHRHGPFGRALCLHPACREATAPPDEDCLHWLVECPAQDQLRAAGIWMLERWRCEGPLLFWHQAPLDVGRWDWCGRVRVRTVAALKDKYLEWRPDAEAEQKLRLSPTRSVAVVGAGVTADIDEDGLVDFHVFRRFKSKILKRSKDYKTIQRVNIVL